MAAPPVPGEEAPPLLCACGSRLVEAGYVRRDNGSLELTPEGSVAADRLSAAGRDGLARHERIVTR